MGCSGSKGVPVQHDWDKNIPLERQLWPDELSLFDKRPDTGKTAEHPTVADADEPKAMMKKSGEETIPGEVQENKIPDVTDEDTEWTDVKVRVPTKAERKVSKRQADVRIAGVGASLVNHKITATGTEVAHGDDLKLMNLNTPDHLNEGPAAGISSSKPKSRNDSAFPVDHAMVGGFKSGTAAHHGTPLEMVREASSEISGRKPVKSSKSRRESHGLVQPSMRPPTRNIS